MKVANPFGYYWPELSQKYIYYSVLAIVSVTFVSEFQTLWGIDLPVLRYFLCAVALYYLIKGIVTGYSLESRGVLVRWLSWVLLLSVVYSVAIGLPAVLSRANDYLNLKRLISGQLLLSMLPFLVLFKPDLFLLRRSIELVYFLAVLYLVFTLPFFLSFAHDYRLGAEYYTRTFASGAAFIFLTLPYHRRRVQMYSVLALLVSFTLMAILARRNEILYLGAVFFFAGLMIMFSSRRHWRGQRWAFALALLGAAPFILLAYNALEPDFSLLTQRIETGERQGVFYSRVSVINEFVNDFNSNPEDWYFGKGMNGSYEVSLGIANPAVNGYQRRDVIENGYLYLILKGGLFYLIPFILVSLVAVKRGMLNSSNLLSKAAAAMVLINLIDMVGFGLPDLTVEYILIWLSLGICLSDEIRSYSDDDVQMIVGLV